MKTKFKLILALGVVVLTAGWLAVRIGVAAESRPRAESQAFMRLKLAWSQGVLEGLTLERFEAVSANALRMRTMTHSNLWYSIRQPEYMTHTTNFQKSVDALYLAAVDKNLEAATEAYLKVTRNCIACHRMVRTDQRKAAADKP